jgi:AcrR family transcriptional regulator
MTPSLYPIFNSVFFFAPFSLRLLVKYDTLRSVMQRYAGGGSMSRGKLRREKDQACEAKAPGRPRCPVAHQAMLDATNEILGELGFVDLTIEGVAARAGVGKTTIYRRWPDKASLVMDAFFAENSAKTSFPDTGSTREDIRRQIRALIKVFNSPAGRTIAALIAGGQVDHGLAEAFRKRWIEPHRSEARQVIKRGVRRGEIRPEIDLEALLDALYGPLYFRLLTNYAPLTPAYADRLVELVMSGLVNSKRNNIGTHLKTEN